MSKHSTANIGNDILCRLSVVYEPLGRLDEPAFPAVKIQISEVLFASPYSNGRFAPHEITPTKGQHNCFVSKKRDRKFVVQKSSLSAIQTNRPVASSRPRFH